MSDLWEDCLEKSEEKTVFGTTGGPGNCWPEANTVFCRCAERTVTVTESRSAMRCREKASIFIARPKGTNWSASGRTIGRVSASSGIPGSFRKGSLPSTGAFGTVACSLPESERLSALDLLVDKYSADFKDIAAKYIAGSFHRTEILRLDIEHLSGKHKELHK